MAQVTPFPNLQPVDEFQQADPQEIWLLLVLVQLRTALRLQRSQRAIQGRFFEPLGRCTSPRIPTRRLFFLSRL